MEEVVVVVEAGVAAEVVIAAAAAVVEVVEALGRMQSSETGQRLIQSVVEVVALRTLLEVGGQGGKRVIVRNNCVR